MFAVVFTLLMLGFGVGLSACTENSHGSSYTETMQNSRHFMVSGNVQGVGFRAATQAKARELQLAGWVKNLSTGEVEVLASGEAVRLDELEDWLQNGPSSADVTSVTAKPADELNPVEDADPTEAGFVVRY